MTQDSGTDVGRVVADDERLGAVQDRIDGARAAESDLERQGLLEEPGERLGVREDPDEHGAFEPSGDDRRAGENPLEGPDADTPGEA